MKIFLFFVIFFSTNYCENLAKLDIDQAAQEYSKQEKKPEQIEVLENSDILQEELQDAMGEINKTQNEDAPIALSPEVVNALLHNLNYLRKQKEFPAVMQDENFEKDFKNPKNSDKAIKTQLYKERIKKEKIKELVESIDRIKRSQKRGDQEDIDIINKELEEYENKYNELQHQLFDKDGKPTNNDDPYNKLVQHIDIVKAKIEDLSEKISDMKLKDFSDKDIQDIKDLLYDYQLILKDLLQQRVDYLKLKDHQDQQLQKEIQINELNKQKTSTKDKDLENQIDEKQKELRKEEEELDEKEKSEQAKLDLEQELEILHEKERIPATEDEREKIKEEEENIKQQMKEVDQKLMGTHRVNKIMLKYKLNTKVNPMFHNIDPILDEDFKDTEHISDKLYNADISLTSYRDLFRIHDLLIKLQFRIENLFKGYLTDVDQVPKDQDFDENENLVILKKLADVVIKIKNDFNNSEKLYERVDRVFEEFDPHKLNWINFYDQQEFQNITIERAKVKHVHVMDISENEQEVEELGQQSISDIEKVSVCVKDIGILLNEMDEIKDRFVLMVPPQLLTSEQTNIKIDPQVTKEGFEYAKRFVNIRIDLENNFNIVKVGMMKLQSRKDEIFDKIQELNQMSLDEREIQDAQKPVDLFDINTYLPKHVKKLLSFMILNVLL